MSSNQIKVGLAIFLFICLLKMPYGYYQFVRFISMIGFGYLAFYNHLDKRVNFVYLVLALLFQPFLKISLGRELWNIIDVIVAVGLIYSVFAQRKGKI